MNVVARGSELGMIDERVDRRRRGLRVSCSLVYLVRPISLGRWRLRASYWVI
jgi:hypothetical protein